MSLESAGRVAAAALPAYASAEGAAGEILSILSSAASSLATQAR